MFCVTAADPTAAHSGGRAVSWEWGPVGGNEDLWVCCGVWGEAELLGEGKGMGTEGMD